MPFPLHPRSKIRQKVRTPRRGCPEPTEDWRERWRNTLPLPPGLVGGENEKQDSFCRTTKDWAELNPDLAERRITPGCLGDFFLRGGTGYNKTLPLIIAWHRILVELNWSVTLILWKTMKADLGSHIEREYLAETHSRQWPGLYRIIVLHENNNLCWTDSQQLWVLEALPLICIPAVEKYRYAMRTWRCTLNSVFQLWQRTYGAIYVHVPQPFPNYASLRTIFTNFVHR